MAWLQAAGLSAGDRKRSLKVGGPKKAGHTLIVEVSVRCTHIEQDLCPGLLINILYLGIYPCCTAFSVSTLQLSLDSDALEELRERGRQMNNPPEVVALKETIPCEKYRRIVQSEEDVLVRRRYLPRISSASICPVPQNLGIVEKPLTRVFGSDPSKYEGP